MSENNQIIPIQNIQNLIFTMRNNQVMMDRDLAELYGVKVKRLNEQVKRNLDRFPENFRFQLNDIEKNELVANCDRFKKSIVRESRTVQVKKKCAFFAHTTQHVAISGKV